MPIHLVDGGYRLRILADVAAFRQYVTDHKELKMSNMMELLGIFSGKRGGSVDGVRFKQKHMLLHDVIWVTCDDGSTIVPLVGSPKEMFERLRAVQGVAFAYPTVKDLLNNSTKKIKDKDGRVWQKTVAPPSVASLRDGDSLLEARPSEATPIYPDGNVRRLRTAHH